MEKQLIDLVTSPYLIAALLAYLSGQWLKICLMTFRQRPVTFRDFFMSGNMPSTHTASTVALTVVVGFSQGFDSAVFAVAAMLTLVVAYDAMHVRRAVGEQGLVLRELIDRDSRQEKLLASLTAELDDRDGKRRRAKGKLAKPYFSRGHLPIEVIAGGVLGLIIGVLVSVIML